jgi:gliding motility associated protien GldN
MKKIINILTVALLMAAFDVNAQPGVFQPGDYRDGIYDKENANNRRYIPYTHLREADVVWEKRVWRELDLREKINQPLFYPINFDPSANGRLSLIRMLSQYIIQGKILAFVDEDFMVPFEIAQVKTKLVECDSVKDVGYDAEGNEITTSRWNCDSVSLLRNISVFRMKEDWFFDKQKSVLEVRILGLQVLMRDEEKGGLKQLFWVYFPACRPFFAKHEVYNMKNDSERRTFEDVFWKRQFSSKVFKETNVYDRQIDEYSKGIDALLESDRVKQDIFQWEHDLWHF